ncbi:TrbC family F-type conjugative pilus assembly protein [Burkholderia ubonensis]|uniref:TrbC family F-type conjugative pilus assembly protein n=1 Tax=Burkholderia ubonensis TaxID=101571 RepID=UPI00075C049A|nr:TrbC family F-type conjugative pilus assembly protein [Burkholderia ubonensis]
MMKAFKLSVITAVLACSLAHAQTPAGASKLLDAPALAGTSQAGVNRMKGIIDGVSKGNVGGLSEETRAAISTGQQSAKVSSDVNNMDAKTVDFAVDQSKKWEQMAREAYVAALPPRDRALGASVLLGDSTAGGPGRIYVFVSRSMPQSLLRAYAVDAFYMGAELVVKGVRKGDTLKEFLADAIENFNSVDGMTMAGLNINPNLFDMFDVKVVPAVVWTNRVGLDDVGSGCQNVPDGTPLEQLNLEGPNDTTLTVEKPTCAKLPETSYYKLSGALAMPYVLDRFQEAGLAKDVVDDYRAKLAERTGNVHDGSVTQTTGHAMAPVSADAKLDRLPKAALLTIKEQLAESNVQRGPFGPTFSPDDDDDPVYRQELTEKIRHGLGL